MNSHICNCEKCQHQMCTKRVPIFASLEAEELRRVANLILRKEYAKGELIIMEGERFDNLVIINQGQVKAFRNTAEGKEQILYIFSEGDFFGEKNILREQKSAYHVEALEKTKICMITKKDFQTLMHELPEIGVKIIDELSNRIDRLENMIQSMGTNNVDVRIGTVLLEFANKYGRNSERGLEIDLPLSREGIANYIGLTRETVSRKLSLLQDEGIIEMSGNKKIILPNLHALEELIE